MIQHQRDEIPGLPVKSSSIHGWFTPLEEEGDAGRLPLLSAIEFGFVGRQMV